MNYRFRPDATISEMAQDVATASVWMRDHAKQYDGDPEKTFLLGHCAGAHLVAAVAATSSSQKRRAAS